MKKFMKEFKDFALKGNVMNLAVGVIIGGAFQGIITSLTENILSPLIGLFTKQNFDTLQLDIWGISLRYGAFITAVINFIIMALVVFIMVKSMNRLLTLGEKEAVAPAPVRKCPFCCSPIADAATRCPSCTSELS